jgi:hypothetical protein
MQGFEFITYFEKFPELRKQFIGVFSIDTLPKIIKYRTFCICNTDVHNGIGKHWICFIRNEHSEIECFDSLGITDEKRELLSSYCKFKQKSIIYNETKFQKDNTDSCGLFCLYFLIERMHNLDLTFEELLEDIFCPNEDINESRVSLFCDKILQGQV